MIKNGKSKLISVKYSPQIYTVAKLIKPSGEHKEFVKDRYLLKDHNNEYILQELKLNDPNDKRDPKLFFGNELLSVGDNRDNTINKDFNNNDAFLINTVQTKEFTKEQTSNNQIKLKKIK